MIFLAKKLISLALVLPFITALYSSDSDSDDSIDSIPTAETYEARLRKAQRNMMRLADDQEASFMEKKAAEPLVETRVQTSAIEEIVADLQTGTQKEKKQDIKKEDALDKKKEAGKSHGKIWQLVSSDKTANYTSDELTILLDGSGVTVNGKGAISGNTEKETARVIKLMFLLRELNKNFKEHVERLLKECADD